jgi:hypothetical protein
MKLTKSELELIDKLGLSGIENTTTVIQYNRFSGAPIEVSQLVSRLVDAALELYRGYENRKITFIQYKYPELKVKSIGGLIQKFDRIKYLVCKLDSNAYSELLD